jgi:integrase
MPRARRAAPQEAVDVDALLGTYREWLARQSLAARSRAAYAAQVARFIVWLASSEHGARALSDPHVRDWAVRDYKRHVKSEARWAPASVNQALAAIDNFYRSLGAGRPEVPREDLPQLAPRALEEVEQRRFLRAVEASPSPRDRAIATVFFYTALRLSPTSVSRAGGRGGGRAVG